MEEMIVKPAGLQSTKSQNSLPKEGQENLVNVMNMRIPENVSQDQKREKPESSCQKELFSITEARDDQLETLLEWRETVLREVFADTFPKNSREAAALMVRNRLYYMEQLGRGHHAYFIRNKQKEIIGCGGICLQQEMPSPDNPTGVCAYFMNIYVRPQDRHKGAARELVKTLIRDAKFYRADKIYLETSEDGRPLYMDMGFHEMEGYLKYPVKL